MARHERIFVCQACGTVYGRWQGKCDACGGWNTVAEENAPRTAPVPGASSASSSPRGKGRPFQLEALQGETAEAARTVSGIAEFDRVTGGGFVRGSVLLVGGDPGIGKSTLLIQASAALARAGGRVVYISGEEATAQVRLRAERLGLAGSSVALAAETNVEDIIATLSRGTAPQLVIIDSIQTMWSSLVEFGARNGDAGARLRPVLDPLCEVFRRDRDPRRPCDQGWRDRGPARRRAYGGCGHLLRRRWGASLPHPAGFEKSLRADRRDRRLRDDRGGARGSRRTLRRSSSRGATSMRRAPPSSPAWRARGPC